MEKFLTGLGIPVESRLGDCCSLIDCEAFRRIFGESGLVGGDAAFVPTGGLSAALPGVFEVF